MQFMFDPVCLFVTSFVTLPFCLLGLVGHGLPILSFFFFFFFYLPILFFFFFFFFFFFTFVRLLYEDCFRRVLFHLTTSCMSGITNIFVARQYLFSNYSTHCLCQNWIRNLIIRKTRSVLKKKKKKKKNMVFNHRLSFYSTLLSYQSLCNGKKIRYIFF